jgi:tetratricopeptide (TPR) repeat protein
MPENPRLEELRRRVQADPASIAFAALAEEYRRIGHYEQAIETCRVGLQRHPAYLSARVTLGRALIEIGEYEGAKEELETVLRSAPENLAAIRGLAQIHDRLGHVAEMHPSLVQLANEPLPVRAAPVPPPVEQPVAPEPIETAAPAPIEESAPSVPDLSFAAPAVDAQHAELQPIELAPLVPVVEAMPVDIAEPPTAFAAAHADEELDLETETGPDAATVATLARLEQFLGAIQHARSTSAL